MLVKLLNARGYRHDARPLSNRLGAIDHHVHDELLHLTHVRYDRWQARRQIQLQSHRSGNRALDQADHVARETG